MTKNERLCKLGIHSKNTVFMSTENVRNTENVIFQLEISGPERL